MTQLSLIAGGKPEGGEVVYYGTDGLNIKIGRTINTKQRGGALKITILYTVPGGAAAERRHHRMWDEYRIQGTEWFRPEDDLLLWLVTKLEPRDAKLAVLQATILRARGADVYRRRSA